jgi:hypothetical protein
VGRKQKAVGDCGLWTHPISDFQLPACAGHGRQADLGFERRAKPEPQIANWKSQIENGNLQSEICNLKSLAMVGAET